MPESVNLTVILENAKSCCTKRLNLEKACNI